MHHSLLSVSALVVALGLYSGVARADPQPTASGSPWSGVWSFAPSAINGSSVFIELPDPSGFHFVFEAYHGINMGGFEGMASIVNDGLAVGRVDECAVTFKLRGEKIEISTQGCEGMGGLGISFDGRYQRGVAVSPPRPTLFDSGILHSKEQQKEFDRLVGKASERFVLDIESSGDDLDGFGAKVTQGCPPHMCSDYGSIVMASQDGRMWVATVDPDTRTVLYFTNVLEWKSSLPSTISVWTREFEGHTIVYASD